MTYCTRSQAGVTLVHQIQAAKYELVALGIKPTLLELGLEKAKALKEHLEQCYLTKAFADCVIAGDDQFFMGLRVIYDSEIQGMIVS